MKNYIALCLCLTSVGCASTPSSPLEKTLQDEGKTVQLETCRKVVRTGSNIPKQECTTHGEREAERASSQDMLERNVQRPNPTPSRVN